MAIYECERRYICFPYWKQIDVPSELEKTCHSCLCCVHYTSSTPSYGTPSQQWWLVHSSKHPDIGNFNPWTCFNWSMAMILAKSLTMLHLRKSDASVIRPILTSGNLRECYEKPYPLSPLGLSDHCAFWKPKITVLPNTSTKHINISLAPYLNLECEHLDLGFEALNGINFWKPPVLKIKQTLFMKFLIWELTRFQKKKK